MAKLMQSNVAFKFQQPESEAAFEIVDGATYLLRTLKHTGIDHAFMVPGKTVSPVLRAFSQQADVTAIIAAHETGAGFMADGYARASGNYGVCISIAGPGTANLVPALTSSYADGVPVLAISGGIATALEGKGAFQDATTAGICDVDLVKPVTNYAAEVKSAKSLEQHVTNALRGLHGPKNAPSYVQVSLDVQKTNIQVDKSQVAQNEACFIDVIAIDEFIKTRLASNKKVAILAGNKLNNAKGGEALKAFAEKYQVPVATSLMAKGVLPEDHDMSLGVFGFAGTKHANDLFLSDEIDVLIAIGCDMNQRNTMAWSEQLRENKYILQVDSDSTVLNKNYQVDHAIVSQPSAFLNYLTDKHDPSMQAFLDDAVKRKAWVYQAKQGARCYDEENTVSDEAPMHPARVVTELRKVMPRDTVMVVDSGAHRVFAGHYWQAYGANQYLTAASLAPMGWAIPAAIGAKVAKPDSPCVAMTGDGCMMMHGMEIQTAARYNIPVMFVVINNSAHGGIHLDSQLQDSFSEELTELPTQDWKKFAESLGVKGYRVTQPEQLAEVFEEMLSSGAPCLVDVVCTDLCKTPIYPFAQAMKQVTV